MTRAKLSKTAFRSAPLAGALLFVGCVSGTDIEGLHKHIGDVEKKVDAVAKQSSSKEEVARLNDAIGKQATTILRSNADLGTKFDDLTRELQVLAGRLEDANRRLTALSQQMAETPGRSGAGPAALLVPAPTGGSAGPGAAAAAAAGAAAGAAGASTDGSGGGGGLVAPFPVPAGGEALRLPTSSTARPRPITRRVSSSSPGRASRSTCRRTRKPSSPTTPPTGWASATWPRRSGRRRSAPSTRS